ncbi:MAG: hypothetical protein HYU99_03520 [Deltaproteobacteria bacterium]|nr:hypothetical protein [Deltaproteobacteria bacterium]
MEKKEEEIGVIKHYYNHINVAGVVIAKGALKVGDKIHVKGHTTDFEETISAIELDHKSVTEAKAGDDVGIKVVGKCREHDKVYKIL